MTAKSLAVPLLLVLTGAAQAQDRSTLSVRPQGYLSRYGGAGSTDPRSHARTSPFTGGFAGSTSAADISHTLGYR